jgi:hypothetical protein
MRPTASRSISLRANLYWVDPAPITQPTPSATSPRARGIWTAAALTKFWSPRFPSHGTSKSIPRVASYAEWTARFFVKSPGAIAAADADPDKDGILNVMECALGLHPLRADVSRPAGHHHAHGKRVTYPAIRFTRRTGVTGLSVLPQHSQDMVYWWDENSPTDGIPRLTIVSVTPLPENMELVVVRSIFSLQDNPRQYLRVWAQVTP